MLLWSWFATEVEGEPAAAGSPVTGSVSSGATAPRWPDISGIRRCLSLDADFCPSGGGGLMGRPVDHRGDGVVLGARAAVADLRVLIGRRQSQGPIAPQAKRHADQQRRWQGEEADGSTSHGAGQGDPILCAMAGGRGTSSPRCTAVTDSMQQRRPPRTSNTPTARTSFGKILTGS